jgi:hypothetical protein
MTSAVGAAILDSAPEETKSKLAIGDPFKYEPVTLTTFIQDQKFLGNPDLSSIQFDAVHMLEPVYMPETLMQLYDHLGLEEWKPQRQVNFGALQWGKGSGKDLVCQILVARWTYLLQCLTSPQQYYGLPRHAFIHLLNIAASAPQANRVFFSPLREMVKSSPWFKGKFETMDGKGSDGKEPGKFAITFEGQIEAISGHSGSSTQEGLNLLGAIADEISEFVTKGEAERTSRSTGREPTKTADAVIKMMRTSGRSRFPKLFKNVYISFPRFTDDAIQQLCAKGRMDNEQKKEKSAWYVSGPYATWEVNPRVKDKADFDDDYKDDPAMAEAMYECKPGRATNRAFRNDVAIAASFAAKNIDPLKVTYYWGRDEGARELEGEDIPDEVDGWQVRYEWNNLWPYIGAAYSIHADLGITGDRAGVAMSHVAKWELGEWEGVHGTVRELRPVVKLDFAAALEADVTTEPVAREVQIRWFRKLVWELVARGFYIARVSYDGFQSTDSLQILESRGIEAEKISCDRADTPVWKTLKDVMYDGRLQAYYHELAIAELRGLRRLPNGKVDHPDGGSKDVADALAGSVFGALEVGGIGEGSTPERADQVSVDYFGTGGSLQLPSEFKNIAMDPVDLTPPT